jgi:hypothetical protein
MRNPFVHRRLQSRIHCLKRADFLPDSRVPFRPFTCQLQPEVCRHPVFLLALSGFNPMPNLIGSPNRDWLVAVGSRLSACRSGLLLANSDRIREIGPGWIPIVAATLEKMTAIDPRLEIRQIKQKCGELRIYYRSHRYEELELAVNEAEVLCGKTCEECGRPGSLFNRDGWVRTLCEEHRTFLRP